jgi:hypothetical protein
MGRKSLQARTMPLVRIQVVALLAVISACVILAPFVGGRGLLGITWSRKTGAFICKWCWTEVNRRSARAYSVADAMAWCALIRRYSLWGGVCS